MSATAGTLSIDFAAETAKFRASLEQVENRLGRLEGSFNQAADLAKKFLGGISVGALLAFAQSSADAADKLGKTADRLNIASEGLKKFQVAAENTGVATETANGLLETAQKRLGEAAAGGGAAAKTLNALGLNVKDLQKLKPDELFLKYGDAIGQLKDKNEQVAAATDLFGNSAQQALTFILQGREALDSASQFVDKYNLALNRVEISQIEAANDSLGDLKKIADGAGQRLALGLAPFVQAIADSFKDAAGQGGILQDVIGVLGGAGVVAVGILTNTVHIAEAAFFGLAAAAARVLQFITFGDVSEAFKAAVDANLARADQALQKVKSEQQILQGLSDIFDNSLQAGLDAQEEARKREEEHNKTASKTLSDQFTGDLTLTAQNNALKLQLDQDFAARQIEIQDQVTKNLDEQLNKRVLKHGSYNDVVLKQENQAEEAKRQLREFGTDAAINLLAALAQKSKTFAKLQVAYDKARALAQAILNTKAGITFQLTSGDPYSAIPRAAAVGAFGAIQIAAILKTGYNEISDINSNGGPSLGSPTNPVFTRDPNNAPGNVGTVAGGSASTAPRNAIQITVNGHFFQTRETVNFLVEKLREELNDKDIVLFSSNSQQAFELGGSQ